MAAAIAMLEPLTAANIAQPAMLVCSRPPGIFRTSFDRPPYTRSPMPLPCRNSAISTNSGIKVSV